LANHLDGDVDGDVDVDGVDVVDVESVSITKPLLSPSATVCDAIFIVNLMVKNFSLTAVVVAVVDVDVVDVMGVDVVDVVDILVEIFIFYTFLRQFDQRRVRQTILASIMRISYVKLRCRGRGRRRRRGC
jgi:hypothetical protein